MITSTSTHVVISDDFKGFSTRLFCIPRHYESDLECVLIPHGLVEDRVERMARDIAHEIGDEPVVALCILKGGYRFFTDVVDKIRQFSSFSCTHSVRISVDFLRVKSYQDDQSTGKVKILDEDCLQTVKGKNVLIVEDVIDTGTSMKRILEVLKSYEPKCVKVASLLLKRTHRGVKYYPDYLGFEVPDKFVVGYAIDYNEQFRDINHICVVNNAGKMKYATPN